MGVKKFTDRVLYTVQHTVKQARINLFQLFLCVLAGEKQTCFQYRKLKYPALCKLTLLVSYSTRQFSDLKLFTFFYICRSTLTIFFITKFTYLYTQEGWGSFVRSVQFPVFQMGTVPSPIAAASRPSFYQNKDGVSSLRSLRSFTFFRKERKRTQKNASFFWVS